MKKIILSLLVAVVCSLGAGAQDNKYYVCVTSENGKIGFEIFNQDASPNKNIYIKYKGQSKKILLKYVSEKFVMCDGCSYPTTTTTYNEITGGKVSGKYVIAYAANSYGVTYTRAKDKKKFVFEGRASDEPCHIE